MNHPVFISGWGTDERIWSSCLGLWPGAKPCHLSWNDALRNWGLCEKSLADGPVRLIGWSLGALIALRMAAQHPEKVSKLVLISGTARLLEDNAYPGISGRILEAMELRLGREPKRLLNDFSLQCTKPCLDTAFTTHFLEQAQRFPEESLRQGLLALATWDLRREAAALIQPVLLIHGEEDKIIPNAQAYWMKDNGSQVRLKILPGQGHALPWSAPETLARMIQPFLE